MFMPVLNQLYLCVSYIMLLIVYYFLNWAIHSALLIFGVSCVDSFVIFRN